MSLAERAASAKAEETAGLLVVICIDGHDMRYIGGSWRWIDKPDPAWIGTWADLKRQPYTHKICMTCETMAAPDAVLRPCNELWSDRTGYLSTATVGGAIYVPAQPERDIL